jgi:hypothetical protein
MEWLSFCSRAINYLKATYFSSAGVPKLPFCRNSMAEMQIAFELAVGMPHAEMPVKFTIDLLGVDPQGTVF